MVQRMKTLTKYLNEKLVIFPSQVDEKKWYISITSG